jgi:hypothetical protein
MAGNALGGDRIKTFTTGAAPAATATATGPTGGPTTVTAVTLAYTYTGIPTSVDLYYTKNTASPYTWVLAGSDTSVEGSYAYTIMAGSGTYSWYARAIGGSSTETAPGSTTPPEIGTYIVDITPPAAPSAFTVQHWGPTGSSDTFTETRYMRGDQQTVNGLTAYQLGTTQSNTQQTTGNIGNNVNLYAGIRVWKRANGGIETEITSGTAVAIAYGTATQIWTATYTPPQTALASTDAIVVRVYVDTTTPPTTQRAEFTTGQLGSSQLDNVQWTVSYYLRKSGPPTQSQWYWGTTTYDSKIANFQHSAIVPGTPTDHNTLNWTHSGVDVAMYRVYRSDVSAGPWDSAHQISTVLVGTNTYCDLSMGMADAILWWYVVRAEDALGNMETNTNAVQEPGETLPWQNITVVAGWNLVSVNIIGTTTMPDALVDRANGGAGLVQWTRAIYYNPSTPLDPWKQYNSGWNVALNDLTAVDHKMGVWLYVTTVGDGQICIGGASYTTPTTTNVNLKAGWNLVGFPSDDTAYTVAMLKAAVPTVTVVEQFDGAQIYLTSVMLDAAALAPGKAYWVYSSADAVWAKSW